MSERKSSKGKDGGGDYEVGRGRPPKSTRFKPGQSGNPHGRPKKTQTVYDVLIKDLARTVRLRTPEGTIRITRLEAIISRLSQGGIEGHVSATKLITSLLQAGPGFNSNGAKGEEFDPALPSDQVAKDILRRLSERFRSERK